MRVLLLGSGGREHVLAWKIAQSPLLTKLFVAPGNTGISDLAECVPLSLSNLDGLVEFALKESIDLTVVGPEAPLVEGVWDRFHAAGLKVFGPSRDAAELEGSKAFSKDMMHKYSIPTAHYEVFSNVNEAKHYAVEAEMPVVIKADGLAAGKGVVICKSSQEAVETLGRMMSEGAFGDAGKKVIIEEMLEGEELSVLALTDGDSVIPLASSQDHKRVYDYDRGPNTGGMGAYSPCPQISREKLQEIVDLSVKPMIRGMAAEGKPYRGLLYAGIMLTEKGPYVLEYNCRFGDPEAQAVIPRLKSDLIPVMLEIAEGKLKTKTLEWHDKASVAVVLASGGYPGAFEKGRLITGLEALKGAADVHVFHAGTELNAQGKVVTAGGRVLAVVGLGDTLREAQDKAYQAVSKIQFEGMHYRRDIGRRALEVLK
ncbi:MAG: phosphoribosylamine--glycine ligase [Candidatus Omnitrophica bacterium]|nr:phosphoribosylamine--glycine ligase [Candidatus Omnitrophota bacterium]